jgi:hypothetical protein
MNIRCSFARVGTNDQCTGLGMSGGFSATNGGARRGGTSKGIDLRLDIMRCIVRLSFATCIYPEVVVSIQETFSAEVVLVPTGPWCGLMKGT